MKRILMMGMASSVLAGAATGQSGGSTVRAVDPEAEILSACSSVFTAMNNRAPRAYREKSFTTVNDPTPTPERVPRTNVTRLSIRSLVSRLQVRHPIRFDSADFDLPVYQAIANRILATRPDACDSPIPGTRDRCREQRQYPIEVQLSGSAGSNALSIRQSLLRLLWRAARKGTDVPQPRQFPGTSFSLRLQNDDVRNAFLAYQTTTEQSTQDHEFCEKTRKFFFGVNDDEHVCTTAAEFTENASDKKHLNRFEAENLWLNYLLFSADGEDPPQNHADEVRQADRRDDLADLATTELDAPLLSISCRRNNDQGKDPAAEFLQNARNAVFSPADTIVRETSDRIAAFVEFRYDEAFAPDFELFEEGPAGDRGFDFKNDGFRIVRDVDQFRSSSPRPAQLGIAFDDNEDPVLTTNVALGWSFRRQSRNFSTQPWTQSVCREDSTGNKDNGLGNSDCQDVTSGSRRTFTPYIGYTQSSADFQALDLVAAAAMADPSDPNFDPLNPPFDPAAPPLMSQSFANGRLQLGLRVDYERNQPYADKRRLFAGESINLTDLGNSPFNASARRLPGARSSLDISYSTDNFFDEQLFQIELGATPGANRWASGFRRPSRICPTAGGVSTNNRVCNFATFEWSAGPVFDFLNYARPPEIRDFQPAGSPLVQFDGRLPVDRVARLGFDLSAQIRSRAPFGLAGERQALELSYRRQQRFEVLRRGGPPLPEDEMEIAAINALVPGALSSSVVLNTFEVRWLAVPLLNWNIGLEFRTGQDLADFSDVDVLMLNFEILRR